LVALAVELGSEQLAPVQVPQHDPTTADARPSSSSSAAGSSSSSRKLRQPPRGLYMDANKKVFFESVDGVPKQLGFVDIPSNVCFVVLMHLALCSANLFYCVAMT
jgi:hypothetical protein